MSDLEREDDGAVGYGRPPKHSQFKKGKSGNPAGRPKGSRNMSTMLHAAMSERVTITENGVKRSITKLEVAFKQLVNKAAAGDHNAMKLATGLMVAAEEQAESRAAGAPTDLGERAKRDKAILANYALKLGRIEIEGASIG